MAVFIAHPPWSRQQLATLKKQIGYSYISSYPIFSVVLPEFQITHLSSYSNPSNFWVTTMPNYFAVKLISHTQLLQPAFTMVILPFKVMVSNDSKVKLFLP